MNLVIIHSALCQLSDRMKEDKCCELPNFWIIFCHYLSSLRTFPLTLQHNTMQSVKYGRNPCEKSIWKIPVNTDPIFTNFSQGAVKILCLDKQGLVLDIPPAVSITMSQKTECVKTHCVGLRKRKQTLQEIVTILKVREREQETLTNLIRQLQWEIYGQIQSLFCFWKVKGLVKYNITIIIIIQCYRFLQAQLEQKEQYKTVSIYSLL